MPSTAAKAPCRCRSRRWSMPRRRTGWSRYGNRPTSNTATTWSFRANWPRRLGCAASLPNSRITPPTWRAGVFPKCSGAGTLSSSNPRRAGFLIGTGATFAGGGRDCWTFAWNSRAAWSEVCPLPTPHCPRQFCWECGRTSPRKLSRTSGAPAQPTFWQFPGCTSALYSFRCGDWLAGFGAGVCPSTYWRPWPRSGVTSCSAGCRLRSFAPQSWRASSWPVGAWDARTGYCQAWPWPQP